MKVCKTLKTLKNDKPEIAHVEIQTTPETHFSDRLLAYSSRLYSEQLRSGETYKYLAPVYSLVFMTANLKEFESLKDEYYHVCNIRRTTKPDLILTRGMCFVIVEFNKIQETKSREKDALSRPKAGVRPGLIS